jgi:hypothetical protein
LLAPASVNQRAPSGPAAMYCGWPLIPAEYTVTVPAPGAVGEGDGLGVALGLADGLGEPLGVAVGVILGLGVALGTAVPLSVGVGDGPPGPRTGCSGLPPEPHPARIAAESVAPQA